MRKMRLILVAAVVGALAVAAVAHAVTNTYSVTSTVSHAKKGTVKKPVPVKLGFDFRVAEKDGLRPALITNYAIFFGGIKANGKPFAACDLATVNADSTKCPAGSEVGSGSIENIAGGTADPSSKALACHLDLTLYNARSGHMVLALAGSPAAAKPCAIAINQGIDATIKNSSKGSTLRFAVPSQLLHPLPGVDNAVLSVQSSISKLVKSGKGYFSSFKCKGSRPVTVAFTDATGNTTQAVTTAKC